MATPNDVAEIVTTTLRNRTGKISDNVQTNTALLLRLKEKGKARPFAGGRSIMQELSYAENSTYTRYSGYETLNVNASNVLTFAEFQIKQAAVAVTMSGLEELQNASTEEVIDLLGARIENAETTFMNNISNDIYSDGTASGGKQIGGLQLLVADNGTGTVGGINSSTWSFWQNQFYDFSANSVTPGPTTIQQAMNTLYLACSVNRIRPDLIPADNIYYNYYWSSLQAIQRVTNEKMAAAGFDNLKFMGADVVFDGGLGGDAPASHMYFLNTDYIFYRPHSKRNMDVLSPDRFATNQDAFVRLVAWAGNMTSSGRRYQGVIVS